MRYVKAGHALPEPGCGSGSVKAKGSIQGKGDRGNENGKRTALY